MNKQSFAARVWGRLMAFEKSQRLLPGQDGRMLAAVSGGPDSVCLAHFLAQMSRRRGFWLGLAHVHHGLRGRAADGDARFVERLAARLGLACWVLRVDAAAEARRRRQGLEEAGRRLRYLALTRLARRLRCGAAATGHHLDDQAETVLLNLLRGTRLAALGAMAPRRALAPGVELVRPLLCLRRAEVARYLAWHDLPSRRDATNANQALTRNWIRLAVLPLLERRQPRICEHLNGLAAQVRERAV